MAFSRNHLTAPDSTFSSTGAIEWARDHAVAGADVGGIPYCPTATSETTSANFKFDGVTLNLAMGTVTASPGAILISQTRNNAGTTFDGVIKAVITDTASAAGSLAMQILGGASGTTNLFSVDKSGNITFGGVLTSTTQPLYIQPTSGGTIQLYTTGAIRIGTASDASLSYISSGLIGVGTGAGGSFAGSLKLTDIFTNNAAALIRTNTALTGGGTGNVPTLTAGPVTGNPTKWLPIDDNGTTRYVPSW